MEKIELISLAKNYLTDFGYEIDEDNTIILCDDNIVSLKSYKLLSLDEKRKSVNTSDIRFILDQVNDSININENSSEVVFVEAGGRDILKRAILSKTEIDKNINLSISNGKVLKNVNKKMIATGKDKQVRHLTNHYSDVIDVDLNYKITDGYPKKNIAKELKMV